MIPILTVAMYSFVIAQEPQECTRTEVLAFVGALETLASPCTYHLSFKEVTVDRQGAIEDKADFKIFLAAARRGADGTASSASPRLAMAFESLVANFTSFACPRSSYRDFEALETSTPTLQLEEIVSPRTWGYLATLRREDFSLKFSINQPGIGHQLHAIASARTNIIYDMQQLLSPLIIDAESLANLAEHEWTRSPSQPEGLDVVTARPQGDTNGAYCMEYSKVTGMPLAVSLSAEDAGDQIALMGIFEYAPIHSGSIGVWLTGGITIIVQNDSALIARWRISEPSFDIDESNARIRVTDQTVLFDSRTVNTSYFSSQDRWPTDVRSLVAFTELPYVVLGDGDQPLDVGHRPQGQGDPGLDLQGAPAASSAHSTGTVLRWLGAGSFVVALLIGSWRWGAARRAR